MPRGSDIMDYLNKTSNEDIEKAFNRVYDEPTDQDVLVEDAIIHIHVRKSFKIKAKLKQVKRVPKIDTNEQSS